MERILRMLRVIVSNTMGASVVLSGLEASAENSARRLLCALNTISRGSNRQSTIA